jgi:hypothetical protein
MEGCSLRMGKIWIKTLRQALDVYCEAVEQNRILKVYEIMRIVHCEKANAYNYQRFLRRIFPDSPFDDSRPVGDVQECLM